MKAIRALLALTLLAVSTASFAAAYSHVGAGTVDYDTSSSNALTPTAHGSCATGNLMLLNTWVRGGGLTISAITGWTVLGTENAGSTSGYLLGRIKTGGGADAPTVQWDGTTQDAAAWIDCFSGDVYTDLSSIVHASDLTAPEGNEVSALRLPSLTISGQNDTMVYATAMRYKTTAIDADAPFTITAPAGLTKTQQEASTGANRIMAASAWAQQTTATNYSGDDFTRAGANTENVVTNGFVFSLKTQAAEVAPTFDSAPSCSALDFNTMRCTADADANAATIKYCVKKKDASAPANGAAVVTCSGGVTSGSVAATGSSQNIDIDITSDPFPIHDFYFAALNVTLYSSVEDELDEVFPAPSGYQYVVRSGSPGAGELDMFDGASPAIVDGDYMAAVTHCDSFANGAAVNALTLDPDGVPIIAAGFDTSRNICLRRFYDISAAAWSNATAQPYCVNNLAPAYLEPSPGEDTIGTIPFLFEKSVALSITLDSLWQDGESDDLSHNVLNLPTGLSEDGETITGTPTVYGYNPTVTLEATDECLDTVDQVVDFVIGFRVPDVLAFVYPELQWMWKDESIFIVANDDVFHGFKRAVGQ